MRNRTLSPLFLQSILGPFPIIGSVASSTPLDIFNPNRTAMLIDQIRFSGIDGSTLGTMSAKYGAGIALEILLGSIPLTNSHVPMGCIAPRYFGEGPQADNLRGPGGDGGWTWHLPKPLYVPPNVQVTINAKRQKSYPNDTGDGGASFEAFSASVIGRSLPDDYPVPGEIDVPWITATQCNTTEDRFVSNDNDLVNSNDVPLHVNQFVGLNVNEEASFEPSPADLTVQISLSNGTLLIRDQIPFFLAFPSDRGILPVNAVLQPGAFARLELETAAPEGGEDFNVCGFTAVAMHGYRRIQTPGTLG